jgi:hypothetical protein
MQAQKPESDFKLRHYQHLALRYDHRRQRQVETLSILAASGWPHWESLPGGFTPVGEFESQHDFVAALSSD